MGIRTGKQWKVYEQAHDGSGCGEIQASRDTRAEALSEAKRLAHMNPGTRYYVLENVDGVYVDAGGNLQSKAYAST